MLGVLRSSAALPSPADDPLLLSLLLLLAFTRLHDHSRIYGVTKSTCIRTIMNTYEDGICMTAPGSLSNHRPAVMTGNRHALHMQLVAAPQVAALPKCCWFTDC